MTRTIAAGTAPTLLVLAFSSQSWALPVSIAEPTTESPPGHEDEVFMSSAATPSHRPADEPPPAARASHDPPEEEDDKEYVGDDESDGPSYDDEPDDGEEKAKNAIFLEGLGPAVFYSLNYERLFFDQVALRVGAGFMSLSVSDGQGTSSSSSIVTIPITLSYVGLYKGLHGLDLGAGTTLIYFSGAASVPGASGTASGLAPVGVAFIGYRLHPVNEAGFQFRIGADMILGPGSDGKLQVLPWGHLSVGVGF